MMEQESFLGVNCEALTRFLEAHDWSAKYSKDFTLVRYSKVVFRSESRSDSVNLILPSEPDRCTRPNLESALETLSDFLGFDLVRTASLVRRSLIDLLSAKIADEHIVNDSVSLSAASELVVSIRNLLAVASTSELTGERTFFRVKKEAKQYADECRFAHTFKGSFGFSVEIPLHSSPQLSFLDGRVDLPFGTRVVDRLDDAFRRLTRARKTNSLSPLVSEESEVSANMCAALAECCREINVPFVEFTMDRAINRERPFGATKNHLINFDEQNALILERAAEQIDKKQPPTLEVIAGQVLQLKSDGKKIDPQDKESRHNVVVFWRSEAHGPINVNLELSAKDYLQAVEAHTAGMHVTLQGNLSRVGRSWTLSQVEMR